MPNSLDLEGRPQDTRVVVAMSGGVDSSVTAALLKSQGYDVVGITLQLYDHGAATHRKGACCAGRDIHDARNVAERIGIPHYVLDYESRFRESVIDNFADSYALGETPVPCIECNRSIKFRDLLSTARELGAQALATGHYVASRRLADGSRAMVCAADSDRDQSYFLFATTREQLDYLRFPLGDMTKPEVRELARRFELEIADKQDSQDICFVPTGRYTDIIGRLKPGAIEPGDIVDLDGNVIGRHQGIVHFTVGQRKGLGIAAGAPLYVIKLDAAEPPRRGRDRARRCGWIGSGCATSTGSATVRWTASSATASRCSCACARRVRRSRRGCARSRAAMKSNSSPAKKACRRARPACSTTRPQVRRACSAADSSRAPPQGMRWQGQGCRKPRRSPKSCAAKKSSGRQEMAGDIDREGVEKAYGRWAPVYDLVFGKVFDAGRQSTIVEADKIGGRILDVGVGTGLSLSDYSRSTKLCGVDISEPMLRRALKRVRALGLSNVETLAVMDAKNLAFRDSFFDAVVAQYVITAVPDPERTLDDFIRVLKPGGELILVNHIGAESGPRRLFELAFAPLARRLGWRPEFPWARLTDWAARHGGVSLTERRPMPPMGHFSLIRFRKA